MLNVVGGSYFGTSEAERGVERTHEEGHFGQEEESEALWGEEAWGLRSREAWGSGGSR